MSVYSGENAWVNYISKSYINLYGPEIQVFRLDKVETQTHELYIEEDITGRIYLPPFSIPTLHDTNKWSGHLGLGIYSETEQPFNIFLNLQTMIEKNRDLKDKRKIEMKIRYNGKGTPSIKKKNNKLYFFVNNNLIKEYDLLLKKYKTIRKLSQDINTHTEFYTSITGDNDFSNNLIDCFNTSFLNREVIIFSRDEAYKNITDIIEVGDAILTERNRLYEVQQSKPAGDFGFNYYTWHLECKLASPENYNLPDNWLNKIKNDEYGLRSKINME